MKRFGAQTLALVSLSIGSMAELATAADLYSFAQDAKRYALVIGNSTYATLAELPSAKNDAAQVGAKLADLGFDVTLVPNIPTARDFDDSIISTFRKKLNEGDLVVFYFSGHGFSYGQNNFIAPADLPISLTQKDVGERAIAVEAVEDYLSKYRPGVLLLIIDACRTIGGFVIANPGQFNQVAKGFQTSPQPLGSSSSTIIAFAARPGTAALGSSNPTDLSIFTSGLLQHIRAETEFSSMFSDVSTDVRLATSDGQQPGLLNWSTSDLFLKQATSLASQEKEAWLTAMATGQPLEVARYLRRHAVSPYAAAARKWLADNKEGTPVKVASAVSPVAVDRAWSSALAADSQYKAVLAGFGGFGYSSQVSETKTVSLTESDLGIVGVKKASAFPKELPTSLDLRSLAAHGSIVTTSALVARTTPSTSSPSIGTVKAGTVLQVDDIIRRSSGGTSWIGIRLPDQKGSAFVPVPNIPAKPSVVLGVNLREVFVKPLAGGLSDLVDGEQLRTALAALGTEGKHIRRVSLASAPTSDERERLIRLARLNNAAYVLRGSGISPGTITAVADATDMTGPDVRVRFFGE